MAPQEQMLRQIADMGFDIPTARRALSAKNWQSVDMALSKLFD